MKNAGGGATAVSQPSVVASDTGGGSAAADSEDDEQWGTGKLVIDLEACQDASGANHRPEASDATAAVVVPASTEKAAASTAVTAVVVSGEPTATAAESSASSSSSSTAALLASKLAAAASACDSGGSKEKPAKLKTKRKSAKKSSGNGGGAGSAPKAESNSAAAAGKKERSSGKKKASGSRAASTGSRSAASTSADKRDVGGKAASRKKKDRTPSSVRRGGGGAAREVSAISKAAAIPVVAANGSRASSTASKVAAGSPSAASADNSQPDSPQQRCSSKRAKVDVPTSSAASGTTVVPIITAAAAVSAAPAAAGLNPVAVAPATRCRDAATDTAESSQNSVAVATEPDCLGPCEPGTHVSLDGIVWQETTNGVLVVNVTWRGKTYVGALLDATQHDWAPPRLQSDSPTSDVDSRAPKSRGTTKRRLPQSSAFQDINERKLRQQGRRSSMQQPLPPPSPARSEASVGGGKRKSSRCAAAAAAAAAGGGCLTEPPPTPTSETASDPEASVSLVGGSAPVKRRRTSSRCSANGGCQTTTAAAEGVDEDDGSVTKQPAATATPHATAPLLPPPPAPQYIECPEPNCSKKYRNVSGLRYHQSHAHGVSGGEASSSPQPTPASAAAPDSPTAASTVQDAGGGSVATASAAVVVGVALPGPGKRAVPSGASLAASPVGTASAADELEPGGRLPPPTLLRVSTLRSGFGPPSIADNGCGAEQLEPTDLSFAVRKSVIGAGGTLPAAGAQQLFGGSERAAAAAAAAAADLPAPKLEPVDCFESVAVPTGTASRRTFNAGNSDAVPPSLAASAATAVPQQLTLGSAGAPSQSSGGGNGGSVLFGSASGSLQLLSAGVPVAAITPQVVKPSSSSSATSSLGLLTLGSTPASALADTRTLTAATSQQHATTGGTKPKAGLVSMPTNSALQTSSSSTGRSGGGTTGGGATQPKLLPRGSSGSTKSGGSGSAGTGNSSSGSALGSLAAAAAAATSCMPSSGVAHPASGTLSLKPIQPKPTILGDTRPAVPPALSDLREQKRRDHRAEKASRRSHQQRGGGSSTDSGPPPLKAEQRSPPLLTAGVTGAAVWSATSSSESQQHPPRTGAPWTAPQQLPNSDREDGSTAADRVATTAEQLAASRHQPSGSPAPGVNGLQTGSVSTWDALPKLKPSRLGAPVIAGVVAGGGCADSQCNKSPVAYSDISSDDSSSERPVCSAAPSMALTAVGPVPSGSGSSDSPLPRGNGAAPAPAPPAVSQQSGGSGTGHVTAASVSAAPHAHHLFSSGLSSSSQPVATVSPRKVVMELPPPLQRSCTVDDCGSDRLYEAVGMPISAGKETASAMLAVARAAESDAETFAHQHRKSAVVSCDEQQQALLSRHPFDGQQLVRSQQSYFNTAGPPPAYWPPPTHGLDSASIDWSHHAAKCAESATATPAKPAAAQQCTPEPHHRAGSAASRSGTLSSSSPARPSAPDQSMSSRSATSTSSSVGSYAKSGGPSVRDGNTCSDSKGQAPLPLLPSAARATVGTSVEGEQREQRRLLQQQLPLREDTGRSDEDGGPAAVAHNVVTIGSSTSSSRKHSHGGTRHSPGSLVAKSMIGERDEAGGGERRSGTEAGDLVRQPRFSPSPSAMAAAAAAAPMLPLYHYPSFALHQSFPTLPFDHQRGSSVEPTTAMLAASFFSFLRPQLFADHRAAAGLSAVESREAISNGSATGSLAAAGGLPSPASGLYGGPKNHQPHKIHELEDPQTPLLPPPLRSASAAAQRTGGGSSNTRSSGGGAASSGGSFLSETVQGNRPPSRASPAATLGIGAPGLAPSASVFGPLSAVAGLSQFLPKP